MTSVLRPLAILFGLGLVACSKPQAEQLPAFGEVVVSIDTDAPVPAFVGRLRVDLFEEDGTWLESRDIARANLSDWPASFSVFTKDQVNPRRVLLRARAYLEGRVRDYRGERFEEQPAFVEPKVASTLSELCEDPPELLLGQELTLRHGSRTLTGTIPEEPPADALDDWSPQCGNPPAGGAVAARLEIAKEDDYRIETTRSTPKDGAGDTVLWLRTDCRDALSQIACNDDVNSVDMPEDDDLLSGVVVHLKPGSYTVLAGGYLPAPADITLRADLAEKWDEWQPDAPAPQPLGSLPRLVVDGEDVTPLEEPQPRVSIDRLALLTLVPGQKRRANIMLRTACGGTMAKLSRAANDAAPVLNEAETCIAREGERAQLVAEELAPMEEKPGPSAAGTFSQGERCPKTASGKAVCVPAGSFVLGMSEGANALPRSTAPERFALMSRFWLDKTEVSVGRWRAALGKGFESPTVTPLENNGPIPEDNPPPDSYVFKQLCTFSASAASAGENREDYPLTCVDWFAARAFCQFEGGELPSEAQWEYAATKAGRAFETRFPWGDQQGPPSCQQAVIGRDSGDTEASVCRSAGFHFGTAPLSDSSVANDATALGVLDLAGNVSEWGLDSFNAFDSPCWNAASLVDPLCWEENAPLRALRGGDWSHGRDTLAAFRGFFQPLGTMFDWGIFPWSIQAGGTNVGFRCAYAEEPR